MRAEGASTAQKYYQAKPQGFVICLLFVVWSSSSCAPYRLVPRTCLWYTHASNLLNSGVPMGLRCLNFHQGVVKNRRCRRCWR